MKNTTTILAIIMTLIFLFALVACAAEQTGDDGKLTPDPEQPTPGTDTDPTPTPTPDTDSGTDPTPTPTPTPTPDPTPNPDTINILVVYFSATNTTEGVAKVIAEVTGGDIWEIVPAEPYTSADLNYSNSDCRANKEQNDDNARPTINGSVEVSQYDVIFVGFPIWWGGMPKIMFTFFDTYNLKGKTIVPFCTSGGSGIAQSLREISSLEPDATILDGRRFASSASQTEIESWVNEINLPQSTSDEMTISITCGDIEIVCKLNDSNAAAALYAQLPLSTTIQPYSDNEMIFYPTTALDTSNTPLAEGGNGVLAYYAPWGDVVLFYGDFNKNSSLFALGEIISGAENIPNLKGTITVSASKKNI